MCIKIMSRLENKYFVKKKHSGRYVHLILFSLTCFTQTSEISKTKIAPSRPRLLLLWSRDQDFLKVVSVIKTETEALNLRQILRLKLKVG